MGRVAASCSGPGRIVSFLTAVPCLSCKQQQRRRRHQSAAAERGSRRRMSEQGKSAASTPSSGTPVPGSDTYKGWLFKWTNYIKGYQRRWFVLSNGLLSYYRTQAEMAHTCRGTINLATAHIDTEDACNIVLSSGGRTYHLKASTEVERQRWVTALELAKAKAIRMMNDQSDNDHHAAPPAHCYQSGKFVPVKTAVYRRLLYPPSPAPPPHRIKLCMRRGMPICCCAVRVSACALKVRQESEDVKSRPLRAILVLAQE
ncbi:Oxysterol-binding protein 2 [Triplophysa tibetana]|uniref:Sesquipedalian n=1 Tax=Triplophysa tibetana TaxID=1572043 RepID=A0A5A9P5A9_9TELE|nr:Oxysterol-binding protein 2 [Triplophysa tibetana]